MLRRIIPHLKAAGLGSFLPNAIRTSGSFDNPKDLEELFQYTTGRWLYNEQQQNQARYVRFDPKELMLVASKATGAGPCTRFDKLDEGCYNKAFRLTLGDSLKVFVRIPCPLAGPSYPVTASEVATLTFAREVLKLPVPRVITWSGADRNCGSNVGADFIMMEEAPGVALRERWREFPVKDPFLQSLSDVEKKFQSLQFSRIGSLYFKEDVSADLHSVPLLSGAIDGDTLRLSEKYCIGPLISHQWWRGLRAHLPLDPGPWNNATSFFLAAAKNEQMVISQQTPNLNQYRRKPACDFATHSKLLSMYMAAVPYFVPSTNDDICAPTLWHPDLSRNNIFVNPSGPGYLKCLVDWQHTATLPYFMHTYLPPAVVYDGGMIDMSKKIPQLPPNFGELTAEEQAEYRLQLRLANRQRWYQVETLSDARRRSSLLSRRYTNVLADLPKCVTRAWADGAFELREVLLHLRDSWTTVAGPNIPCPIEFSSKEMSDHEEQREQVRCYSAALKTIETQLGCLDDGWIVNEDYEIARRQINGLKNSWDEAATGSPFPFQENEYSYFLS